MISTLALCVGLLPAGAWAQTQELNALVWCDHTDDALIKPFEEKFDVTVNLKEYEGTGAALSLIEQSQPGDWDVLVIDGIDVPRAVAAGILGPLPTDQVQFLVGVQTACVPKIDIANHCLQNLLQQQDQHLPQLLR